MTADDPARSIRQWWLWALCAVVLCQQGAAFVIRPMVSYRALDFGADAAEIGMVAASCAVGALLVALPSGYVVDRWGEPRLIFAGMVVLAICSAALMVAGSITALVVLHAGCGIGQQASMVGMQTLVANRGNPNGRDSRFGVFIVASSLGQMAGPALGTWVASLPGGGVATRPAFLSAAVLTVLGLLPALGILARRTPAPRESSTTLPRMPARAVFRLPGIPQATMASLTVLATVDLLAAYLPVYGTQVGLPATTVGLLLTVRAATSMTCRVALIYLQRAWSRRQLLVAGTLLPAVALIAVVLTTELSVLVPAMGVIGLGMGISQPLTMTWVAGRVPCQSRGTALSLRLTGNRLGQIVLPLGAGLIAQSVGILAVFYGTALLLGVTSAVVLRAPFEPVTED